MADMRPLREDLQATLDARRDLGPEYEAALVESFVERLDATIAARVHSELHGQAPSPYAPYSSPPPPPRARTGSGHMVLLALGSMALGVPLVGIAAVNAGFIGMLVTLVAIVLINVAGASAIRHR
ncbi:hypothetical protein [Nonomuraea sediminis]|uniref:hypothetical protein n=1 Tax=Nonomuraea sediminis TaxID=2835864 RepID=UPI001BDD757B|nr:hypothetical protein [Nonomuraea sediminis]